MALTASKKRTDHSMEVKHAAINEVGKEAKKTNIDLRYCVSTGLIGVGIELTCLKQSLLAE